MTIKGANIKQAGVGRGDSFLKYQSSNTTPGDNRARKKLDSAGIF